MDFHDWEPVYTAILADMGFDRAGDERARDLLAALVNDADDGDGSGAEADAPASDARDATPGRAGGGAGPLAPADLDFTGETVTVVGAGPSLGDDLDIVREADTVVAASDAAATVREAGLAVDCMVTDLDERSDVARELTVEGTPVAVHAHGDNRPALRERVPRLAVEWVLPTTQAAPTGPVRNVGGFTDGDRAAFLADAGGADDLVFPGWDLTDTTVGPTKRRKLRWAARLLGWLEGRRGETFAVLDGVRDDLDRSMLPDRGR